MTNFNYRFVHDVVNHAERTLTAASTRTALRTSGRCLKRGLRGTYVAVEPFHLIAMLTNKYSVTTIAKGTLNDAHRFALAMSQVAGKRLTYAELTGKDADSPHTSRQGRGKREVPF